MAPIRWLILLLCEGDRTLKSEQSEIIVVVCMSVLWVEHHLEVWGGFAIIKQKKTDLKEVVTTEFMKGLVSDLNLDIDPD